MCPDSLLRLWRHKSVIWKIAVKTMCDYSLLGVTGLGLLRFKLFSTQMVTAVGKTYHPEHFVCVHCGQTLSSCNYFERDLQPYCERDYYQLFSPKCEACARPVVDVCFFKVCVVGHLLWQSVQFHSPAIPKRELWGISCNTVYKLLKGPTDH